MISLRRTRHAHRAFIAATLIFFLFVFFPGPLHDGAVDLEARQRKFPLVWEHLHLSRSRGGAFYIPQKWLPKGSTAPTNLVDAAWLMAKLLHDDSQYHLRQTSIPRMTHQTWMSTKIDSFSEKSLEGIEQWLGYATATESDMAYFMWNDDGVRDLLGKAEPAYSYGGKTIALVDILPKAVEVADIFRVVVCNTIGGVYADIDTIPLRSPTTWVSATDTTNWTDPTTNIIYGQHGSTNNVFTAQSPVKPVSLILGIEADNEENTDAFWRMGYSYPVQLTQWSLAASSKQPVLDRFLLNFRREVQESLDEASTANISITSLMNKDPLELTGPVAITKAAKDYLAEKTGLRWQALSGLQDGGRSKVVLDSLILPITGFSPGRGHYGNMGSKPISHVDARVQHAAQGSWRSFHLKVELGKACRTFLGRCRDWSKVPQQ